MTGRSFIQASQEIYRDAPHVLVFDRRAGLPTAYFLFRIE
jgi:hypothetical protein